LLVPGLVACEQEASRSSFVARVGDDVLTREELSASLEGLGPAIDSSQARRQLVDQWVTRTLLLREAERLNLASEPEVQEQLEEKRRTVLISALTNRIYQNAEVEVSDAEVEDYFQRHRQQLALREPYVRVRHLATGDRARAEALQSRLRTEAVSDSAWRQVARREAVDPTRALQWAERFVPQSRLFARYPYVRNALEALGAGEVAPVVRDDSLFHVLQLVRRIPAGTAPKLTWIEPKVRRRLRIRSRKQMYAREVQRLRTEAKARNDLVVRTP
jgi:parvulin-like peptidyl-prolyl isomerase